ncbi:MAG: DUF21 domain-containing protein [Fibrobacteria bacterium]|nr:DUF21 domain-containing protein [Fibrobacteria bacterium]
MEFVTLAFTVFLFLILSAFFSGSETGIISCSPLKVKNLALQKDSRALMLEGLLDNKQMITITLLIGTNISNTIYSLQGEQLFLKVWQGIGISEYTPGFILNTLILTPVLVIFAEILPKALFLNYSFSLTYAMAPLINLAKIFSLPFLFPFFFLFRGNLNKSQIFAKHGRETMHLLAEFSSKKGKLQLNQEKMIHNILNLSAKEISDFTELIPKTSIVPYGSKRDKIFKAAKKSFPIPLFIKKESSIIGVLPPTRYYTLPNRAAIGKYAEPLSIISEGSSGSEALKTLINDQSDFALVTSNSQITGYISLQNLLC